MAITPQSIQRDEVVGQVIRDILESKPEGLTSEQSGLNASEQVTGSWSELIASATYSEVVVVLDNGVHVGLSYYEIYRVDPKEVLGSGRAQPEPGKVSACVGQRILELVQEDFGEKEYGDLFILLANGLCICNESCPNGNVLRIEDVESWKELDCQFATFWEHNEFSL